MDKKVLRWRQALRLEAGICFLAGYCVFVFNVPQTHEPAWVDWVLGLLTAAFWLKVWSLANDE